VTGGCAGWSDSVSVTDDGLTGATERKQEVSYRPGVEQDVDHAGPDQLYLTHHNTLEKEANFWALTSFAVRLVRNSQIRDVGRM
jgi:pSer/pThr/pTyr-binding forkhead associated (FHA) protein